MSDKLENIKKSYLERLNQACNKRKWLPDDLNYPINSYCYYTFKDDNDDSYDVTDEQTYEDGMCNGNCNDGRKYKHKLSFGCIFAPPQKIKLMCVNCDKLIKEFQLEYIRCQIDNLSDNNNETKLSEQLSDISNKLSILTKK